MPKSTRNLDYELRAVNAARLLAEGREPQAVARIVGVHRKTLDGWMDDENFAVVVERIRRTVTPLDTDVLKAEALDALRLSLNSENPAAVARAATTLLDRVERADKIKAIANPAPIRVIYETPDGKPYSAPFWTDRNPVGGE